VVGVVRQRPRLVDTVAEKLRDSIVTGCFPAGTQLLQVELAEQLQVSRTPLREALRLLERDGLVRTSNNNRTVEVIEITRDTLKDMFRLRERTDALAARQAAERGMSAQDLAKAERVLDQMEQSTRPPFAPEVRIRAHAEFHELLARASGNVAMEALVVVIRTSCAAMYLPLGDEPSEIEVERDGNVRPFDEVLAEADRQHREILALIRARDPEAAEEAARRHAHRTLKMLDNYDRWRPPPQPADDKDRPQSRIALDPIS
jgi:GntR family transcriptional regulator, vanillate catabolism transcriptional regulator